MMADPELALEPTPARSSASTPRRSARPAARPSSSFGAFALGAVIPLVPWFFGGGTAAVVASLVLAVVAAVAIGAVTARLTDRPAPGSSCASSPS